MPTLIMRLARPAQLNWGAYPAAAWRALRRWPARRRQRTALRDIANNPHLLRDIGVTRQQALGEADKPFWR
ncbi:hypothetical protein JQ615_21125 [Bradyrhizobium jicamae]|uniref:DUF1127 domain-containing protein n=1 Tax=Bradyrhizobium jicamae TaxID=280332 RepID=A0ABS5FMA0_9BRAD|nr:hypothetical protein [Bradyrhizobium jicamae]MBR0797894.1 hypothetical protein [Bradyrhizobium jicamae]MBR0931908.1 hypothetical protein [Bradyrhizobium jicamae]